MKKVILVIALVITMVLQGCSAKQGEQTNSENPTVTDKASEATESPTATVAPTATQKPKNLILPVVGNDTGKTLIQTVAMSRAYPYNSYIITSINGESIVIDPTAMPIKNTVDINPVAILETHNHPDHTDVLFERAYPNAQLLQYKEGDIKTKDFHIYSILSSHDSDTLSTSNVIMIIEVDGLRIAHMGDIGQTKLTKDQLKKLGKIDIAFMQFENSYSDMSLKNEKGFHIIEQLKPTIVIPTHYSAAAESVLKKKYGDITEFENVLEITKDTLPEGTLNVYKILNKHKYL